MSASTATCAPGRSRPTTCRCGRISTWRPRSRRRDPEAGMEIRDARPEDAVAACDVLRQSISQLCVADHRNDPAILDAWLSNKKPEIVAAWAKAPGNSLLVAVEGQAMLAVGSVTDAGEITLNYVAPA